jgi:catechol 2,3-dioxygenase-like lactoylglutathione lyase family enzyme
MRTLCILAASAAMLFAQIPAPNDAGVSMGHLHFLVPNPEVEKKLFIDLFGAEVTHAGSLELLRLPGIYIVVGKANTPPGGGTNGSVVNHIGFEVKDYGGFKAKAMAANVAWQELTPNVQAFATFPDDIRLEIMENKDLNTPVAFHHIHEQVTDQKAALAWYLKEFSAKEGSRRNTGVALIPGGELDFLRAQMPQAPTKGRSLDHIGFEVKNLKAFCDRLKADGVQFDGDYREMPQLGGLKIAFVVDPNGTRIELTEGLAGK